MDSGSELSLRLSAAPSAAMVCFLLLPALVYFFAAACPGVLFCCCLPWRALLSPALVCFLLLSAFFVAALFALCLISDESCGSRREFSTWHGLWVEKVSL